MKTIDFQEIIDVLQKNEERTDSISAAFEVDLKKMEIAINSLDGEYILGTDTHTQTISRALEGVVQHAENSKEAMYMLFHLLGSHFRNHYSKLNPMEMFAKAMASELGGE